MKNMQKLAVTKMSADAVQGGGIGDAIKFLMNPKGMAEAMKVSQEWAKQAVAVVRTAAEPNPWKTADDEAIAGEILRLMEEKKAERRRSSGGSRSK